MMEKTEELELAEQLAQRIAEKPSITAFIGGIGSGKTCAMFALAEGLHLMNKKKVFFYFPFEFNIKLPDWIVKINSLDALNNDSILLIDEIQQYFDSRRSLSQDNIDFTSLINTHRHKNIHMLFTTQALNQIDKRIRERANYYILKEPSEFALDKEDKLIKKYYRECKAHFVREHGKYSHYSYVKSDNWTEVGLFFDIGMASFWSDQISTNMRQQQLPTKSLLARILEKAKGNT